jgi:hypothetical protein
MTYLDRAVFEDLRRTRPDLCLPPPRRMPSIATSQPGCNVHHRQNPSGASIGDRGTRQTLGSAPGWHAPATDLLSCRRRPQRGAARRARFSCAAARHPSKLDAPSPVDAGQGSRVTRPSRPVTHLVRKREAPDTMVEPAGSIDVTDATDGPRTERTTSCLAAPRRSRSHREPLGRSPPARSSGARRASRDRRASRQRRPDRAPSARPP